MYIMDTYSSHLLEEKPAEVATTEDKGVKELASQLAEAEVNDAEETEEDIAIKNALVVGDFKVGARFYERNFVVICMCISGIR